MSKKKAKTTKKEHPSKHLYSNKEWLLKQLKTKTQQQVADELGVNRQTIIRYKNLFLNKGTSNLPKHDIKFNSPTKRSLKINRKVYTRENAVYLKLKCRCCKVIHIIRKDYHNYNCPNCNTNLIWINEVNYLGCWLKYKNYLFRRYEYAGVYIPIEEL